MSIILAAVSVTIIGIICAIILVLASKFMAVKIDERVMQISELLPGINCGACGYASCDAYAYALVYDVLPTNLCIPGGNDTGKAISKILGVQDEMITMIYPIFHCSGDNNARVLKMDYKGINKCAAAIKLFGGQNACTYGCLGFGDCLEVCNFDALCIDSGVPRLDPEKCVGCTLCHDACPNNVIKFRRPVNTAIVKCRNTEKGAVVRKKCKTGCIACLRCVKECPKEAITMLNNLASIDHLKCDACGKCIAVCTPKCIHMSNV